jgi:hypothetical protein
MTSDITWYVDDSPHLNYQVSFDNEQARFVKTVKVHITSAGVYGRDRRCRHVENYMLISRSTGSQIGHLNCYSNIIV